MIVAPRASKLNIETCPLTIGGCLQVTSHSVCITQFAPVPVVPLPVHAAPARTRLAVSANTTEFASSFVSPNKTSPEPHSPTPRHLSSLLWASPLFGPCPLLIFPTKIPHHPTSKMDKGLDEIISDKVRLLGTVRRSLANGLARY